MKSITLYYLSLKKYKSSKRKSRIFFPFLLRKNLLSSFAPMLLTFAKSKILKLKKHTVIRNPTTLYKNENLWKEEKEKLPDCPEASSCSKRASETRERNTACGWTSARSSSARIGPSTLRTPPSATSFLLRTKKRDSEIEFRMENLADSEGSSDWQSFASARSARDLSDLIAHSSVFNFGGPVNRKIQVSFRQRIRNSQTGIWKFRRRKSFQNSKFWLTSKGS